MPDEPTTTTPPAAPTTTPPASTTSAPIAPPGTPPPAAPAATTTDPDEGAKKALDAERTARRDADTARKTAEKQLADAQTELEKLRADSLSDAEKAIADAKAEGANEVTTAWSARLVESEIKVAAAGKLADPADAVKLIDATKFKASAGGIIDEATTTAIASAIDELVKAKPYLAVGVTPTRPGPVGGGPQSDSSPVTRDQLKHMTATQVAQLDPQVVAAALAAP